MNAIPKINSNELSVVFSFLTPQEAARCAQVNKQWRFVYENPNCFSREIGNNMLIPFTDLRPYGQSYGIPVSNMESVVSAFGKFIQQLGPNQVAYFTCYIPNEAKFEVVASYNSNIQRNQIDGTTALVDPRQVNHHLTMVAQLPADPLNPRIRQGNVTQMAIGQEKPWPNNLLVSLGKRALGLPVGNTFVLSVVHTTNGGMTPEQRRLMQNMKKLAHEQIDSIAASETRQNVTTMMVATAVVSFFVFKRGLKK